MGAEFLEEVDAAEDPVDATLAPVDPDAQGGGKPGAGEGTRWAQVPAPPVELVVDECPVENQVVIQFDRLFLRLGGLLDPRLPEQAAEQVGEHLRAGRQGGQQEGKGNQRLFHRSAIWVSYKCTHYFVFLPNKNG